MISQSKQQIEDNEEISIIDILLFLKASGRNVLISTIVCFLIGVAYYFAAPKIYEATVTIQMAMVAGEVVETPQALLEKIKMPLFFSSSSLKACGSDDISLQSKFADKLKPAINKSTPFITLSALMPSAQEARTCLEAVVNEIKNSHNDLSNIVIGQKNKKLFNLNVQLKLAEDTAKNFQISKDNFNKMDPEFFARILANAAEINDLRRRINILEAELTPPQTRPLSYVAPLFAPDLSKSNRPMFTLGISLTLGVFLGLLITGLQRLVPEILRQMREAETKPV
jgi:hypothetical protein